MVARTVTWEVLGPQAGFNGQLIEGFHFTAGKCRVVGLNADQIVSVGRILATYQAYEMGTSEHKEAWLMFEERKARGESIKKSAFGGKPPPRIPGDADTTRIAPAPQPQEAQSAEDALDAILNGTTPAGGTDPNVGAGGPGAPAADQGQTDHVDGRGGIAPRDIAGDAKGDGHGHPGVDEPKSDEAAPVPEWQTTSGLLKITTVVKALDVLNDEHWTASGDPAMAAIEKALGRSDINRADVVRAIPAWTRDDALEAATKT